MEKELVTEASCRCYKTWTVDFVKVTNKAWFYLAKQKLFQSMSNLQTCFIAASFLETE
jgi:hypothetical protein